MLRIASFALGAVVVLSAAEKPRVFVTESTPLQFSAKADGNSFSASGGTSPQNVE